MISIDASRARALRSPSTAALATVRRRVGGAWAQWCGDWSPNLRDVSIEVVDTGACLADASLDWRALWAGAVGQGGQAWVAFAERADDHLARHWFGADAVGPLGSSAAREALTALSDALRAALEPVDAGSTTGAPAAACIEVPASHGAAWSGAVTLGWTVADLRVRLHLGPDRVSAFRASPAGDAAGPARPALAPLSLAARDARIRLRAELVGVQLSLGELKSLRPGDALRLEHRIDRPLTVSTAAGEALCKASLGERDGHRAIRLMPTDTASPATAAGGSLRP
jgi:hypothetical protein